MFGMFSTVDLFLIVLTWLALLLVMVHCVLLDVLSVCQYVFH